MKKYIPMFLSWTTSYEQEVEEFKNLISGKPDDILLLRNELRQLKARGAKYQNEN